MTPFSVIIPFRNEELNVTPVIEGVRKLYPHAEIIAVNDASTDATAVELARHPSVRRISFKRRNGQGRAVHAGLSQASHPISVVMDGDNQYDPADIQMVVDLLIRGNHDLVCGYRKDRQDPLATKAVSRLANIVRHKLLGDSLRDGGCGLKAMKTDVARQLLFSFEGTHRYIGTVFQMTGKSVVEVPITHRSRTYGKTKYTHYGRALRGLGQMVRISRHIKRLKTAKA